MPNKIFCWFVVSPNWKRNIQQKLYYLTADIKLNRSIQTWIIGL